MNSFLNLPGDFVVKTAGIFGGISLVSASQKNSTRTPRKNQEIQVGFILHMVFDITLLAFSLLICEEFWVSFLFSAIAMF